MGYPGLVLWVLLAVFALWNGFRKALNAPNEASRRIALLLTLGLLTYFAHAFLNDFLHDARVAALVWGAMAGLCCAECRRKATAPKPLFPAKW